MALTDELVNEIVTAQNASGAFASTMVEDGAARDDENGFVTAQVLRALGPHTADARLREAAGRALDFLAGCEDPDHPGAYRFWTDTARPAHVPVYPADADDTAVISLELARHGRLDTAALRATVLRRLFPHRVAAGVDMPASWVRPGVFWTWLADDFGYNVVDCTVNANVAALLAVARLTHLPCYEAVGSMIETAVGAAGDNEHHVRCLSPYYPHPNELLLAVDAAVAAGAHRLRTTLEALRKWARPPDVGEPVFCSSYGRVRWHVPLLHHIRAARTQPVKAEIESSSRLLVAAATVAPSFRFSSRVGRCSAQQTCCGPGETERHTP
ncbi:hypothetical protein ACGFK1_31680 [Mycobacterium sp. NPDC048908]|uniref:hypothetical protein n=1 Tax=Mycobacterium sp. NPDC048908 TaxID=3364292 RepID=UPI0037191DBA